MTKDWEFDAISSALAPMSPSVACRNASLRATIGPAKREGGAHAEREHPRDPEIAGPLARRAGHKAGRGVADGFKMAVDFEADGTFGMTRAPRMDALSESRFAISTVPPHAAMVSDAM